MPVYLQIVGLHSTNVIAGYDFLKMLNSSSMNSIYFRTFTSEFAASNSWTVHMSLMPQSYAALRDPSEKPFAAISFRCQPLWSGGKTDPMSRIYI